MAYFPNGTAGAMYEAEYCERCWHGRDGDCAVWSAHLLFNGEPDKAGVLDELIPLLPDEAGRLLWPGECRMFVPLTMMAETR